MKEQKIPKGYKKTEIGIIPENWEVKRLGDLINITSGESPVKFKFVKSGIPYYKVEQLNTSLKYQVDTNYFINYKKPVERGSIIFPKRGAAIFLNKIRILSKSSFFDTNLMALIIKKESKESLFNEFLYYYLSFINLGKIADTTSVPQINNKHIKPYKIPLPPLLEQKAIVKVLSDIDKLIESLDKLMEKKKLIKKGVMQELLTGKKRLPGFKGEWVRKKLGEITELYQPETISQDQLSHHGKYYVYGANGIIGKYDKYNHKNWQNIITCRGSTCGTVNKTTDYCWITGNAMVVNVDNNKSIDKLFLFYLLKNQDFTKLITGSGQPQIVRGQLEKYEVYYPKDIKEQQAIAKIFSDMDAEIEALEKKKQKYEQIKKGAMELLLTGKIRVKNFNSQEG